MSDDETRPTVDEEARAGRADAARFLAAWRTPTQRRVFLARWALLTQPCLFLALSPPQGDAGLDLGLKKKKKARARPRPVVGSIKQSLGRFRA